MLDIITFTGIDNFTSFSWIREISKKYPRVEFGVLIGSHTEVQDNTIFPSLNTIKAFKYFAKQKNIPSSLHLCGEYARMVMEDPIPESLYSICKDFDRVQVNLHGDIFNPANVNINSNAMIEFAKTAQCKSVILQHRESWSSIPVQHPLIEYLFDISEGRGLESFDEWPDPNPYCGRTGYSGGLSVHNIEKALDFIANYEEKHIWLDMESQVRNHGIMDLSIVEQICSKVFKEAKKLRQ